MEKLKLAAITALTISLTFSTGCNSDRFNALSEISTGKTQESEDMENMLPVNETKDGILMDNLMDCLYMIGKTPEEAKIPKSIISNDHFRKTYADGQIFGSTEYGIIYFDRGSEGNVGKISHVWIHVKNLSYDRCHEELVSLYGEPTDEGENPYVEADGGAVNWANYDTNGTRIRLSCASERDYVEMEFTPLSLP